MLALRLRKQLSFAIAGLLLIANFSSVAFANDITVSDNGSSSDNTVNVTNTNATAVNQQNTANISNAVVTTSKTGGNTTTNNTGGDTSVSTGNASSSTDISTAANKNVANISAPSGGNMSVAVSGNGSWSSNTVNVSSGTQANFSQNNTAAISTDVINHEDTGDNLVSGNTGGDTQVSTGDAQDNTSIITAANKNYLSGSLGGEDTVSLEIKGNGSRSVNTVIVNFPRQIRVMSNNELNLYNKVVCKQNTGNNVISGNTDGSAMLSTGEANCNTTIKTVANLNKIVLPQEKICKNIPPVTPPSQQEVPPFVPEVSAPSAPSAPTEEITSVSVPTPEQVLGIGAPVLPVTGTNVWENVLLYIVLGAAGLLVNSLSRKKGIAFIITLR